MITEADAAVAVPPRGFVRAYVRYAVRYTDAPLLYHLGVGLSLLAMTAPKTFWSDYAGRMYPNLFVLLVGRSGDDRKTTALKIGRGLLKEAAAGLVGKFPGSVEGLQRSVAEHPAQIIFFEEFGSVLARSQGGYLEPIKAAMNDLYDCTEQEIVYSRKAGRNILEPRISVVAACATPYLERHTEPVDWQGGFFGRWLLLYASRERLHRRPSDPGGRQLLVDNLRNRSAMPPIGPFQGLTAGAERLWDSWFDDVSSRKIPNRVAGIQSRVTTLAWKIATLYALDYGEACGEGPWRIDEEVLIPAIRLAELHLSSLIELSATLAESRDMRDRRAVLQVMPVGEPVSRGELLRNLNKTSGGMLSRRFQEVLLTLLEEGAVDSLGQWEGSAAVYRRLLDVAGDVVPRSDTASLLVAPPVVEVPREVASRPPRPTDEE